MKKQKNYQVTDLKLSIQNLTERLEAKKAEYLYQLKFANTIDNTISVILFNLGSEFCKSTLVFKGKAEACCVSNRFDEGFAALNQATEFANALDTVSETYKEFKLDSKLFTTDKKDSLDAKGIFSLLKNGKHISVQHLINRFVPRINVSQKLLFLISQEMLGFMGEKIDDVDTLIEKISNCVSEFAKSNQISDAKYVYLFDKLRRNINSNISSKVKDDNTKEEPIAFLPTNKKDIEKSESKGAENNPTVCIEEVEEAEDIFAMLTDASNNAPVFKPQKQCDNLISYLPVEREIAKNIG